MCKWWRKIEIVEVRGKKISEGDERGAGNFPIGVFGENF